MMFAFMYINHVPKKENTKLMAVTPSNLN